MLIHSMKTGYSIAYVNTWRSLTPRAELFQHILLTAVKFTHFSNKKKTEIKFIQNQPQYSEEEDYFDRNQQQYDNDQIKNHWNKLNQPDDFFHPDIFEPNINFQQRRQMHQLPPQ